MQNASQQKTPTPSNVASIRLQCEEVAVDRVMPAKRRLRTHSKAKLHRLERSMAKWSQLDPIAINANGLVIDGHARLEVARRLGWPTITAVKIAHLTEEDERLFAIAANKEPQNANWDLDELKIELEGLELAMPDIDLTFSGFSMPEIDSLLGAYRACGMNDLDDTPEPPSPKQAVSRIGDLFLLGDGKAICGDARDPEVFAKLMADEVAQIGFTDPPYNVAIDGHVSGKGGVRHREFAMASGEMSKEAFEHFLTQTLGNAANHLCDGALSYVCMDHAQIDSLCKVGAEIYAERKNIVIWDKGSGGMGALYRSRHEMIGVFKKGKAPHINNVELGKHGRNRTNVWNYPGIAGFGKGRKKALSLHPTVKPVALVADAILDASRRGDIVLDPFGGSGTTLIAAQAVQRRAFLVEVDPLYTDVIVQRFEAASGQKAVHVGTGLSFADLSAERLAKSDRPDSHQGEGVDNE